MHVSETLFVKIEGTEVTAVVDNASEAKIAIKELRHKKKEIAHQKRALLRQKKAAEGIAARAKRKTTKPRGFLARTRAAIDFLAGLPAAFGRANAKLDLARIEREIAKTDDIAHNINAVILQIEGKLVHLA